MNEDISILLDNLKSDDDVVRMTAAEELRSYPTDEVISALIKALNDKNRVVSKTVENSLLYIRGAKVIKKVIPLLKLKNRKNRDIAYGILCRIGNDSVYDIIALLKDEDNDMRKFGADILGELHSKVPVETLIYTLNDSDINVAAAAAESLGKIKDPRAITELVKKLESDVWLQCSVIKSLGMFNEKRASSELCKALPNIKGMSLLSAVTALGDVGDISAIPVLINLINKENITFKSTIVTSLEKIMKKQGGLFDKSLSKEVDIEGLLTLLSDAHIQTKISTINVLGWLKNKKAIKPLVLEFIKTEKSMKTASSKMDIKNHIFDAILNIGIEDISYIVSVIESEDSPDAIKAELIDIIGRIKGPSALQSLIRLKDSKNPVLRRVVARMLGEFDHPDSIKALKSLLKDPSEHPRKKSVLSLGKLKAESAADDLISAFDDEVKIVKKEAAVALAQIGTKRVVEKLKSILASPVDNEKKKLAFLALGKIKSDESMKVLAEYLKDKDPFMRKASIKAISEFHVRQNYEKLIRMIDDNDYEVKAAAIKGLANADPKVVAPYLIDALNKKSSLKVKLHLIETLGDLKAAQATQTLIDLLEEKSNVLVLTAIESLGKLKDVRAIEPLKRLYESDDKDIAMTAKEAVNNIKSSLLEPTPGK